MALGLVTVSVEWQVHRTADPLKGYSRNVGICRHLLIGGDPISGTLRRRGPSAGIGRCPLVWDAMLYTNAGDPQVIK